MNTKKYNIALPVELFEELKDIADSKQVTVANLLKQFIKTGLMVVTLEDKPDSGLIIRDNGKEQKIIIL